MSRRAEERRAEWSRIEECTGGRNAEAETTQARKRDAEQSVGSRKSPTSSSLESKGMRRTEIKRCVVAQRKVRRTSSSCGAKGRSETERAAPAAITLHTRSGPDQPTRNNNSDTHTDMPAIAGDSVRRCAHIPPRENVRVCAPGVTRASMQGLVEEKEIDKEKDMKE